MKINIQGNQYTVDHYGNDIVLTGTGTIDLVIKKGWEHLQYMFQDNAIDNLIGYVHAHISEAIEVSENEIKAPSLKEMFNCLNPNI